MTLTPTDAIALLKQLDESAIGGEWTVRHDRVHHPMVSEPCDVYIVVDGDGIWVAECGADKGSAEAIAAARNAAPALAQCLREMADENASLRIGLEPQLDALKNRIAEVADYGCGVLPTESADASLDRIERALLDYRRTVEESLCARIGDLARELFGPFNEDDSGDGAIALIRYEVNAGRKVLKDAIAERDEAREAMAAARAEARDGFTQRIDAAEAAIVELCLAAHAGPVTVPPEMSAEVARLVNAIRVNVTMRERAERERDSYARSDFERQLDEARGDNARLTAELAEAMAECERMRPVYEAAVEWRAAEEAVGELSDDVVDEFTAIAIKARQREWQALDKLRAVIDTGPSADKGLACPGCDGTGTVDEIIPANTEPSHAD